MPKLVTLYNDDAIKNQARQYVRSYILFPSGLLGLVSMLGAVGGLAYQVFGASSYSATTFLASSGLLILGGLCGWAQTRYHRYLFDTIPQVFAARIRSVVQQSKKRHKIDPQETVIDHPGRVFVPLAYAAGLLALVGSSVWSVMQGAMEVVPAVLMPWAGFYWGKLFFWRGVVQ